VVEVLGMKYCLFCGEVMAPKPNETVMSGLFAWGKVFETHGGSWAFSPNLTKDLMEEFDVIHVNYTPGNASYMTAVRDALGDHSSTKIVANVDHALLMWSTMDPFIARDQLLKADRIFHVESLGAGRVSQLIGKPVPVIPHPVDVKGISKYRKPFPSLEIISCQHHRYLNTWVEYWFATYNIRKEYGLRTVMQNWWGSERPPVAIDGFFDDIIERTNYDKFLEIASESYLNMDITHDRTYGRGIVDFAGLGVPTVGSNSIEAMNRIWPELACNSLDTLKMEKTLRKLLENPEFMQKMSDQGIKRAKYYDFDHSWKRMKKLLED
jgi:hypothetical protein